MSKIRVYLVEDQRLLRESLRTMLELEPEFEVVGEAGDAERALSELGTLNVDVVLMDIGLPGMNGIEATAHLKEKRGDVAVVVLTFLDDEHVAAAIEVGASGYILKSCTRQDLLEALRTAYRGQVPIDPAVAPELLRELAELRKAHRKSLLTPRQIEVLKLVAGGMRYKDIAGTLFVSESTVNREIRNIFDRLGVNDAAQAVSEAYRRRIL